MNNKLVGIGLAWALGFAAVAAEAGKKDILLAVAGPVDAALAARVRAFVQENTGVPVRLTNAPADHIATLTAAAKTGLHLRGPADGLVVVLAWPETPAREHVVLKRDAAVAAVNVRALLADNPAAEKQGRRCERGAMQAIGWLLGIKPCPNPLCALFDYQSLAELDSIGRNYCPPCHENFRKVAAAAGLDTDNGGTGAPGQPVPAK